MAKTIAQSEDTIKRDRRAVTLPGGYQFSSGVLQRGEDVIHAPVTPLSVAKVNVVSRPRRRAGALPDGKKCCSRCQSILPADADHFQRDKHAPDGLTGACKDCRSVSRKASYWSDREKWKRRNGFYYAKRRKAAA